MYLYFDSNGVLKEIVNDEYLRQGSDNYNRVYCYFEGLTPSAVWKTIKYSDDTYSTETLVENTTTAIIPYNKHRDLKYFKDFTSYEFYYFDLSSDDLSHAGLNKLTIRLYIDGTLFATGLVPFSVESSAIQEDSGITAAQYDYLIELYSDYTQDVSDLTTFCDLDTALTTTAQTVSGAINELVTTDTALQASIDELTEDLNALDNSLSDTNNDLSNETEAREAADETLQANIDAEATARENADTALQTQITTNADDISALETRVNTAENNIDGVWEDIDTINAKIPSAATSSNQLADKSFVNSSIATATATFRGSYELIDDLGLTTSATDSEIITALASAISTADNNDYCFVLWQSASGNTNYTQVDRYKYNGSAWEYEYTLNNSSFTAEQWASINSGITSSDVTALDSHILNTSNPHGVTKAQVGLGNVDNTSDVDKPISTATQTALDNLELQISSLSSALSDEEDNRITEDENLEGKIDDNTAYITNLQGRMTTAESNIDAINAKIPSQASSSNQLADKEFVNSSISTATATFKGTYTSISSLPTTDVDENDYAFVVTTDSSGNTVYNRYKYSGGSWLFEYALNNSSFTAEQWVSINSGITSSDVSTIEGLVTRVDDIDTEVTELESTVETNTTSISNIEEGTTTVGKSHEDGNGLNIANNYALQSKVANGLPNLLVLDDVEETTTNGITYSVTDGVITLNGTSTSNVNILLATFTLQSGTYYFKSFGETGEYDTYFTYFQKIVGSTFTVLAYSYSNVSITLTEDTKIEYRVVVRNGVSISNIQFKDMLVKGSYIPDTFSQGIAYATKDELDEKQNKYGFTITGTSGATYNLNTMTRGYLHYITWGTSLDDSFSIIVVASKSTAFTDLEDFINYCVMDTDLNELEYSNKTIPCVGSSYNPYYQNVYFSVTDNESWADIQITVRRYNSGTLESYTSDAEAHLTTGDTPFDNIMYDIVTEA